MMVMNKKYISLRFNYITNIKLYSRINLHFSNEFILFIYDIIITILKFYARFAFIIFLKIPSTFIFIKSLRLIQEVLLKI